MTIQEAIALIMARTRLAHEVEQVTRTQRVTTGSLDHPSVVAWNEARFAYEVWDNAYGYLSVMQQQGRDLADITRYIAQAIAPHLAVIQRPNSLYTPYRNAEAILTQARTILETITI